MRKLHQSVLFVIFFILSVSMVLGQGDNPTATVTALLNVRSEPTTDSSAIEQFDGGTLVELLARNETGTWVYVKASSSDTEGWVAANFLFLANGVNINTLPLYSEQEETSTADTISTKAPLSQSIGDTVANQNILFEEDFSDNSFGWATHSGSEAFADILDGQFHMALFDYGGWLAWTKEPISSSEYDYEFTVSDLFSPENNYCILAILEVTENGSSRTLLALCQDGNWSIKINDEQIKKRYTPIDFTAGGTHRIRVEVRASTLTAYVDGTQVFTENWAIGKGGIGFGLAGWGQTVTISANFDDLVVYEVQEAEQNNQVENTSNEVATTVPTQVPTATPSPEPTQEWIPPTDFPVGITVENANNFTEIAKLEGHGEDVNSVTFSPDGTMMASASDDRTVILWDAVTGEQIRVFEQQTSFIADVAFSPDGQVLASAGRNDPVFLWDVATGQKIAELPHPGWWIYGVDFSPDGRRIATVGDDYTVRLWDAQSYELLAVLEGHPYEVMEVAFSPDASALASADAGGTIIIWDVNRAEKIGTISAHNNIVYDLDFSPDGKLLASASHDGTVKLWDTTNGRQNAVFSVSDRAYSVAFSPDGKILASGNVDSGFNNDYMILLWDVENQELLNVMRGHTYYPVSLDFSPDGLTLASAGNFRVRLWGLDPWTGTLATYMVENDVPLNQDILLDKLELSLALPDGWNLEDYLSGDGNYPNRFFISNKSSIADAEISLTPLQTRIRYLPTDLNNGGGIAENDEEQFEISVSVIKFWLDELGDLGTVQPTKYIVGDTVLPAAEIYDNSGEVIGAVIAKPLNEDSYIALYAESGSHEQWLQDKDAVIQMVATLGAISMEQVAANRPEVEIAIQPDNISNFDTGNGFTVGLPLDFVSGTSDAFATISTLGGIGETYVGFHYLDVPLMVIIQKRGASGRGTAYHAQIPPGSSLTGSTITTGIRTININGRPAAYGEGIFGVGNNLFNLMVETEDGSIYQLAAIRPVGLPITEEMRQAVYSMAASIQSR